MTNEPAPETDAMLAAATEDSSATASPPSDWPAFARALEIQRNAARAERDAANALSLSLCADRDGDAKDRDDEIAVLRAERILSWKENTKQRHELDEVWAKLAECRAALEMIASADGATTPGTAAWASAEIARAALATLAK